MNVNVTIVIQMINFFITYKIVDRFLLRPIMNYLDQSNIRQKEIFDDFKAKESHINHLQNIKQQDLKIFKEMTEKEFVFETFPTPQTPLLESPEIDEKLIDSVKITIQSHLVERIFNAH